ncbi:MAG TPA: hypothetical protein VN604_06650 [Nitrospirota bacterium]|nr:hypothetical protein [Nitrospirota bacterium]
MSFARFLCAHVVWAGKREGGELRSRMETIETYIVRIYRRDDKDDEKIMGLVETAGKDKKERFGSREELYRIIRGYPAIRGEETKPKTRIKHPS